MTYETDILFSSNEGLKKNTCKNVSFVLTYVYLFTAILCFIGAICYSYWFSLAVQNYYNYIIKNMTCYQYSPSNLTVVIPHGMIFDPAINTDTISYPILLRTVADLQPPFSCDWNPCNSATSYTINNNIKYCSYYYNGMTFYHSTPYPVYLDSWTEYYRAYVISYTFLWVYCGPGVIIGCMVYFIIKMSN